MEKLAIALDWTPNTIHTGFFVAKHLNFYQDLGIDLEIITPLSDNYQTTPAKKLELGLVDFALAPTESVISLLTKANKFDVKAIAALLQSDCSAIITLKQSGLDTPKSLDQHIYASYKARYEDFIVKKMIMNDGGEGNIKISYPDKLDIWDTLLNKEADATWIFTHWEGLAAESKNILLNEFKLQDFGIPYSYSPVIIASEETIHHKANLVKAFLEATKKGYLYCINHPKEAIDILSKDVPERDKARIDLLKSQEIINKSYTKDGIWGAMDAEIFNRFIKWLKENKIEESQITAENLYTNDLLN
ncbi:ABC transporter substrate-binding protein [Pelobium sp.]|nr:ABC transporter substrate-binding protein [Pelobium sp.]MDA9554867.1 ABC transporter substrate-binding protein [Pelobium sp.]